MNEIKPRIVTGDLGEYPLCGGPRCPSFSCYDGNEYVDARCGIIREPIPRWKYYPCAPALRDKLEAAEADVNRLERERDRLQKRTEEGCHWACLDAEDDEGLPFLRSHHPDCAKERYRRAEYLLGYALRRLKTEEKCRAFAEAEVERLTDEMERLRADVTRWANEFEARHGVYPEITAAADDLRAALAGEVVE